MLQNLRETVPGIRISQDRPHDGLEEDHRLAAHVVQGPGRFEEEGGRGGHATLDDFPTDHVDQLPIGLVGIEILDLLEGEGMLESINEVLQAHEGSPPPAGRSSSGGARRFNAWTAFSP